MVDFNMPTTDRSGLPPARFTISFTALGRSHARVRYRIMHPSVFFVLRAMATSELADLVQLTPAGVPIQKRVEVRSNIPIAMYFIEVRLEELDQFGNVSSSKTRVMTIA